MLKYKAWILNSVMYAVCLSLVDGSVCLKGDHCTPYNKSYCLTCKDGYYGDCCNKTCNYCKAGTACERDSGACKNCTDGCSGPFCNNTCADNCKTCVIDNRTECLAHSQRSDKKQNCTSNEGYSSNDCDPNDEICAQEETSSPTDVSLVGVAILPAALLTVVIALVCKIRKEQLSVGDMSNETPASLSRLDAHLEELDEEPSKSRSKAPEAAVESTYYFTIALKERKILVDALEEYVRVLTDAEYMDEFQSLPAGITKPCIEANRPENILKNRYREIYPYDASRVIINNQPSEYINASYIDGYNRCRAYIACLGPTVKFMGDMSTFWKVVWQENCSTIVMLTKLRESGVNKCDQYWPKKDQGEKYGDIFVAWISERQFEPYTVRTFNVFKRSETRVVRHLHFTDWPDQGVPKTATTLIEFRNTVNDIRPQGDGPLLVHCSAGVGRTGTYIALDMLTKEGKAEGQVDIYACVRNLREQRVKMVQNVDQYKFLHRALVYSLCGKSAENYSSTGNYSSAIL